MKSAEASDGFEQKAAERDRSASSKIIPISSAARLSERLAEVGSVPAVPRTGGATARDKTSKSNGGPIPANPDGVLALQSAAVQKLKEALAPSGSRSHVLVYGAPGTGRLEACQKVARDAARGRQAASDCIYVGATPDRDGKLQLFRVPQGAGEGIVADVRDALQKASAMLSRHVAGDGHQMSLAMLEEDHRQRSNGGIEELKRRAESQNIALVNTSEGFVLAPMHEGRVVRADVFRALPDSLQRDVEAKISTFEGELQSLLEALPGTDIATDERHAALCQQTAERALKPSLALARKRTAAADGAGALIDAIEDQWLAVACDYVRRGDAKATLDLPSLSVFSPSSLAKEGAPVVVARALSAVDLFGEVGRDARGAVVVRPGALALAAGGFLIIDAWRLASDPHLYAALSAAIESGEAAPIASAGLPARAEAQPLEATIIVICEQSSLQKLRAIDPRFEMNFSEVVHFDSSATAFDVSEDAFAQWAAALAKRADLRPLEAESAQVLYDDARARAGDLARVSLDGAAVLATLTLAGRRAAGAGRSHIGADDVSAAIAGRVSLPSQEVMP